MPINFGLIEPGNIADKKLAPAIKATDGANLWSVTSRSLERAEDFAARHGAKGERSAFDNYEEMFDNPDLDAVMVAMLDKLHAELGIKAFRAGKHVLNLQHWAMTPVCDEVVEIKSIIANDYWGSPHDETAMVNMKFESEATAELTTSVLFESEQEFKVYGDEGGGICRDTIEKIKEIDNDSIEICSCGL